MSFTIHINDVIIYRFQEKVIGPYSTKLSTGHNYIFTGQNGVGKTSLLKAIKGTLPIRSGSIQFEFQADDEISIFDWKRKHVTLVSFDDTNREFLNTERYYQQRFHAFDSNDFTVAEYLEQNGYEQENADHKSIIESCGLSSLLHVSRIKLSSGQTRNFLIARALLKKPQLMLLDNPYVGLDTHHRQSLNTLIDDLSLDGHIQFILAGQYSVLPKSVTGILNLDVDAGLSRQIDVPIGVINYFKQIDHWPHFEKTIELIDTNIGYLDKSILSRLNWSVLRGEKWAVLGGNGSGKSTLIGLIAADHPQAYQNNVIIFGRPRSRQDSIWDIKKYIGFSSSELHAYFHDPTMSCGSIVRQGLFETIYNRKEITKEQLLTIDGLFHFFEVEDIYHRRFQHCSTGEQRLILFLRALIKNPPLLLLDEPFQGLDPLQVARAKKLLETALTKEHSLLFISHFENEIPKSINHQLNLEGIQHVDQ